ncbi:MAG: tRNA (adenosine(37)-N6)-threonylcarbamoyltransferase complex dimerization subunit type 1 TsaB [Treponema sp.]|jgi:tRNA threonylcarbamoyladenosine biosynthesis protein TsaB|nr:tRNA (adenosine(37)-N6)-threonylcarbamoyltransferase complex dimerization subunit type 1 TsaB [Treponema sp.]
MNLAAIDSCSPILSVAISAGNDIHCQETDAGMKHNELVMDYIDSLMKKAALKPSDLDGVLCMGGPGSFTGLRIGYSAAKGLALSLSIPFIPIPTLECIAYQKKENSVVLAVLEARKKSFFYAFFKNNERLSGDADAGCVQIEDEIENYLDSNLKTIYLTGYGSSLLYDSMHEDKKTWIEPDNKKKGYAKELIAIARNKNLFSNYNKAANSEAFRAFLYSGPEYIRETDAQIALKN